jgi:hypothetical protein
MESVDLVVVGAGESSGPGMVVFSAINTPVDIWRLVAF